MGNDTPGQVFLHAVRKVAESELGSQPERRCFSSCLQVPDLTSLSCRKPSPPHATFGYGVHHSHSTQKETGAKSMYLLLE